MGDPHARSASDWQLHCGLEQPGYLVEQCSDSFTQDGFPFLRLLDATLKVQSMIHRDKRDQTTQPRYSFNSSDSSNMFLKEKGTNAHPLNSANLEKDSTQANLSE